MFFTEEQSKLRAGIRTLAEEGQDWDSFIYPEDFSLFSKVNLAASLGILWSLTQKEMGCSALK